ncbi:hypothetical protein [Aliiruegeria lutimaris]|uniref:hypothetical protein n=1 Tax=Aliiruegeria lutimaris TaxID=571298 RepID=UPI000B827D10|nr:hypothetical protein [Aliiruegeria lutimaris]
MRKLAVWMTVSTAILIAWATLAPSASLPTPPGNDKVHHLIGFAALTFPAGLLYQRSLIWVLPFAILFGGMIEIIQPFVGRHREVADFVAGTAGALVGAGIGWTFRAPMLLAVSRVERFRGP